MYGAIIGDISGSIYEFFNRKTKPKKLIGLLNYPTDDSVLTIAVAKGIYSALKAGNEDFINNEEKQNAIKKSICKYLKRYTRIYPFAGYGGRFTLWAFIPYSKPYNSWGNGSAMRVSYAGEIAHSMEEAMLLAKLSAEVTHNHELGIKGSQVVAGCIYLLKNGADKEQIREYASKFYNVNVSLNEVKKYYKNDASCENTVPPAIIAFLNGTDFEDAVKTAITLGGDSDTIAAITGSIAEYCYGIPDKYINAANRKLTIHLKSAVSRAKEYIAERKRCVQSE